MKKFLAIVILTFLFLGNLYSQIPAGYYDSADGLTGQELQEALHQIIKNHNSVSYNSLHTYFEQTDKKPNGKVWDMYSDVPGGTPPYSYNFVSSDQCGNYSHEGDCYNREHSWPKSWFGGKVYPMYSDLFHIYPTDGYVNSKRSNYPYGEVSNPTWTSQNGSKLGNCSYPGYSGIVFEPIDEYKGDFARSYFYMSVRYYSEDGSWQSNGMVSRSQLKPWALNMLRNWNDNDPVSQKEIDRNNAVYQIQENRNPFIDHPEYAFRIWDSSASVNDFYISASDINVYPNPVIDYCFISINKIQRISDFEIFITDITGRKIETNYQITGNLIKLNTKYFNRGIYFVNLVNDNFYLNLKIVK
ncbi:MAG: endonuclease [Bacteroidales bacterium]|nr:endonuclease [Bacteroidales bacterium]